MSAAGPTTRHAACACGQLTAACAGEPVRVSVCHCLDCQRRSGSAFAAQARFPVTAVTVAGRAESWTRTADSGLPATFHFCPGCGSTLWYTTHHFPDLVAVPVGAFADPKFPAPHFSVYESRRHAWVSIGGAGIEHHD